jgi:catechol 2,3-dioxygenase-like lactoylglutathione lyase family enzyme
MTLECSMLYVKDFARMREFYGNVLQAEPVNREWTDTWALFDTGGAGFALHAIPEASAAKADFSSPPQKRERSPVKLIFGVEDMPAERARLEALGVTMLQRSWQEPAESCDWADPEGNVFQIAARARVPHLLGR